MCFVGMTLSEYSVKGEIWVASEFNEIQGNEMKKKGGKEMEKDRGKEVMRKDDLPLGLMKRLQLSI